MFTSGKDLSFSEDQALKFCYFLISGLLREKKSRISNYAFVEGEKPA
ncbi:hypothetical protein TDIS_1237 [Thermosulfurimonas dismutans]|uniref:Uncharacterized protein n=1 Tax=Thermosulfurimonas dismutans TaxID=999894 RepID=A0A179D586_9BACT|nr:hypothetical protein TDIS_1237 [Thermosulfurimonas dismutans]